MIPYEIIWLDHHWFKEWLVTCLVQSPELMVTFINWILRKKPQWNFNQFQSTAKPLRFQTFTHRKLDESTSRRQLKPPRSLSGRSIHLTLVTKWSWSWSWMTHCHPLCAMSIGPPILRYSYFKIWPWKSMVKVMCVVKCQGHIWPSKFKVQGYGQGQTHWSP